MLLRANPRSYRGVDPNPEGRDAVKNILKKHPRADYVVSDARETGLEDASADLVVVAERFHIGRLERLCPDATYALINDFNPAMPKGQDLDDPWYGPASGFRSTLADIEAAMPGILDALA